MPKVSVPGMITSAISALGINSIPAIGLFVAGWTPQTAMLLYLLENLVAVLLGALLVHLLVPSREETPGSKPRDRRTVLNTFLLVAITFSVGSSIFMAFFLFKDPGARPELDAVRAGLAGILAFQLFGFLSDFVWLRPLSLVQGEKLLERSLGRVFLLYLAVFVGIFLALFSDRWFLVPFVGLKTMVDVGQPIQFLWERSKTFRLV